MVLNQLIKMENNIYTVYMHICPNNKKYIYELDKKEKENEKKC